MAKNVVSKAVQRAIAGGLWQTYIGPDTQGPTAPVISALDQVADDATALDITWTASQDARSPPISSYQLQITLAADTGFASVVQTLTYSTAAATAPQRITGLTASTAYIARVRAYDSASTPNAGSWSATGSQSTPAGTSAGLTYPARAAYLQGGPGYGTADDNATERQNRAVNRWVVLHWHPGVTLSQLQTHIDAIHAVNADCKVVIYTGFTRELHNSNSTFATLRNKVLGWSGAGDLWARTTFPSGGVVAGFPNYNCVNQAGTRVDSVDGLTWSEWSAKWLIDTYGAGGASYLNGVMYDNCVIIDSKTYDYDENGTSNSPSTVAMKNAQTANFLRRQQYIRAQKPTWWTVMNGIGNICRRAWTDVSISSGDIDRIKSVGIDAGIFEYPTAFWNAANGIFWWTDDAAPAQLTSIRTYPANGAVSVTPATGTLVCNTFGGWGTNINGGTTNPGQPAYLKQVCEIAHASQFFADPRDLLWQCHGPAPSRIGVWSRVTEHMRWCAVFPALMGGWSCQYSDIENPEIFLRLDEHEFDWGEPIDSPGIEVGPISLGVYQRRFRTSTYDVLLVGNPIFNGTRNVTLLTPRSGHQWYKFDATDFDSQDTTFNNGALVGTTLSLTEHNGAVLISAP